MRKMQIMQLTNEQGEVGRPLTRLPLATLYLSERCNSRCVSCDYWRHGKTDLSVEAVDQWIPGLRNLATQVVLISGGEPLLNPHWPEIAAQLRNAGLRLWLLSSGLSLAKHAGRVAQLFETVTVSLDGADAATYQAIRGLDAFDRVCEGIRAVCAEGTATSIRVTVQRDNFQQLPRLVTLAKQLGARQISFLAADVSNRTAFGRGDGAISDIALQPSDLPLLEAVLKDLAHSHADEFASGMIAESPLKLQRILQYYTALCGLGPFPAVRCNAPEHSAVLETGGQMRPCFFIPGPHRSSPTTDLLETLNAPSMQSLRAAIAGGERSECQRCVCSMWFEPGKLSV
jgi:Fe-coproporphyrin III synthase